MTFNPLNEYFDHIYVITLKRATERHNKISEALKGLNYSFFFGADKQDFDLNQLKQQDIYDEEKAKHIHRYSKPMNGGQIGCAWSHKKVHQDILEKGYSKVLILEDDVTVAVKGVDQFNKIVSELPADWELLYLDYARNEKAGLIGSLKKNIYRLQHLLGGLKWSRKTIANLYAKPFSPHLKHAGFHDYTDAYALTASGAKKLVDLQTPIAFIADNLLAYACTNNIVKGFISVPKLFNQESQSDKNFGSFVND
jgi:glycosyl transferase, family 25